MCEYMYTDDITEFIETLPKEKMNKILSSLSKERKAEIDMILNFWRRNSRSFNINKMIMN